jgi:hypothetical protein
MIAGCSIRLSTPPRLSASVNTSQLLQEAPRARQVGIEVDRDDAAVAVHLAPRQFMLRVRFQARIVHLAHLRLRSSHCARSSAFWLLRSTRRARVLMPRSTRKLSNGPWIAPTAFWMKPSRSRSVWWCALGADHRHAADHVRVAVHVLGGRVHDDVDAQFQRALHDRAGEGVVADGEDAALAALARDGAQVGQLQHRVGRRLDPHHLRLGTQRAGQRQRIGQVDVGELVAGACAAHALEQAVGAAVHVVAGDDVRAGRQQFEHGGDRRQAGGEGEGRAAAFDVGHAALQRPARRVVRAAVVEALVHAGTLLDKGRGGVDRRHHGAGARVGRLAAVDDAGGDVARLVVWMAHDRVLRRWLRRSKRVIRP